jgi:pyrroline-5-carboxylate reductase
MSRAEALEMAMTAMRGAATLMESGESADAVAQNIATPGGSTARGLKVVEEDGMKQLMQEAVVKAASKVGGLGKKK